MRVIVTGSTLWTDAGAIRREFAKLPPGSTIVHGDCPGVDALAGEVARELGLPVEALAKAPEDETCDPSSGWKRLNEQMLERGASLILAFHPELNEPGKALGSIHMVELARARLIEVRGFTS
jgi:hypothetical protein